MPREGFEIPTEDVAEGHDLLDKTILVAIVVTALLAAITALGQISALKRHDEEFSRAIQGAPAPLPASGPESLAGDPYFPVRYLADHRRGVFLLEARATLASEHAQAEERQFTRFGVSLTLFATGVFLLGFALSPYGRI